MSVSFRFANTEVALEVQGPDAWVDEQLRFLGPFLRRAAGARSITSPLPTLGDAAAAQAVPAPVPQGLEGVVDWWRERVPAGFDPGLQDAILLFAYYMRGYRKTVFLSDDIRRCFQVLGMDEPRSLLQVMGAMRRDAGLLLSAGKRGEYMMNTTGIARAREILGEKRTTAPLPVPPPRILVEEPAALEDASSRTVDVRNIFRD